MSDEKKALARIEPEDQIAAIQQAGREALARKKDLKQLYEVVQGRTEWGNIRQVSPQTQFAVARMAQVAKADPLRHIDILGDRPYLNAEYYEDRMSHHPAFVSLKQDNITEDATLREQWGAPDDAEAVYLTHITRFLPSAPIASIKAGRIPFAEAMQWTHTYTECNWAGHRRRAWNKKGVEYEKRDDVGRAESHKTARTRSIRRCAKLAFSAWSEEVEREIRRATFALDDEMQSQLIEPSADLDESAVTMGDGEPEPAYQEPEPDATPAGPPPEDPEALLDARKRFFATLRTFGMAKEAVRKAWMAQYKLPGSVTEFRLADFDRADQILVDPVRKDVQEMCKAQGLDLEALSQMVIGQPAPDWASHWTRLQKTLKERQQQEEAADNGQEQEQDDPATGAGGDPAFDLD